MVIVVRGEGQRVSRYIQASSPRENAGGGGSEELYCSYTYSHMFGSTMGQLGITIYYTHLFLP